MIDILEISKEQYEKDFLEDEECAVKFVISTTLGGPFSIVSSGKTFEETCSKFIDMLGLTVIIKSFSFVSKNQEDMKENLSPLMIIYKHYKDKIHEALDNHKY